jgi:hypothetical protein
MKFRKVLLLFMIVSFGVTIEGLHAGKRALDDGTFDGFNIDLDDDFPWRLPFRGQSTEFTESETVDVQGVTRIEITNTYGDVNVTRASTENGRIAVNLRKRVYARKRSTVEEDAAQVKLVLTRDGATLRISTTREDKSPYRMRTSFDVEVPTPLDVTVANRRGKVIVEGVGAVDLTGESDEMRVTNVTGDCVASNKHGDLIVVSSTMGCRLRVEHGDAHIEHILAPSRIDVAHGNLHALDLAGLTVTLKSTDMQARKINGPLSCEGEHADLQIDDVKGDVTLTNRGNIDLQNVFGRVSIENLRGHVRVMKAAANVVVKNSFDEVAINEVAGLLEVTNERGGILARGFRNGARLQTDSEDVEVSDFSGPLNVVTRRSDVRLKPERKVTAPIDIEVDVGDIRLGLPEAVDATLDASVERGDVKGDVGALRSSDNDKRSLRATMGNGGPLLKLRSRLGDIRVLEENEVEISEPRYPNSPDIDRRHLEPLGADPLPAEPIAPPDVPKKPKAPKPPKTEAAPAPPAPPEAPKPTPGR